MFQLNTAPVIPPFSRRAERALSALRVLMRDHSRLDQVLVFTEAVNGGTLARAVERIAATATGRTFLRERRYINRTSVDFERLRTLPPSTLGRQYVQFLDDNGISPEPFEVSPDVGDPRIAYIMMRMRQTHDLWHVLTGYRPDVEGEILLQAFTFAQVGAPSALLIALFGTLRWRGLSRRALVELRAAYRHGKSAQPLATVRWEDHWETPVAELREALGCPAVAA